MCCRPRGWWLLALIFWGWFRWMQWVAATHITAGGEPNLVGYSLCDFSVAGAFYAVGAGELGAVGGAAADDAREVLRRFGFRTASQLGKP